MTVSAPPVVRASGCYETLAPFYDAYTAHPGYPDSVRRLESLARRHGLRGNRALDVGCGTGKSMLPLLELGYDVDGCDPSPAMLAIAAEKIGSRASVRIGGLPHVPAGGPFDYVSCLNDVLNHVAPEDLEAAFATMAAVLRRGGVLVADSSTVAPAGGRGTMRPRLRRSFDVRLTEDERLFLLEALVRGTRSSRETDARWPPSSAASTARPEWQSWLATPASANPSLATSSPSSRKPESSTTPTSTRTR